MQVLLGITGLGKFYAQELEEFGYKVLIVDSPDAVIDALPLSSQKEYDIYHAIIIEASLVLESQGGRPTIIEEINNRTPRKGGPFWKTHLLVFCGKRYNNKELEQLKNKVDAVIYYPASPSDVFLRLRSIAL